MFPPFSWLCLLFSLARACDPGMYLRADACYACMAGTYSSTENTTTCALCGPGRFANQSGVSECAPCSAGSFQYAAGSSECLACLPGSFQADLGMTACLDCPIGQAQAQPGSDACVPCLAGSFAWSAGSVECEPCGVGSYQPFDHATLCTSCSAGKVQPHTGSATCAECRPGTRQPTRGQETCISCDRGEYQPLEGATACISCPPGTVQETTGQFLEDACLACPSGTFKSSPGWDAQGCAACALGTFSAVEGASVCLECEPGSYQSGEQATACIACPAGTFSQANTSSACEPCQAGTYSVEVSATSLDACLPCGAGNVSSLPGQPISDACTPCPPGTFQQGDDHAVCVPCPDQAYCPDGLAIPCGPGLECNGTHLDAKPGLLPVFNGTAAWTIACPHGTLCAQRLDSGDKGLLPPWPQQVHFVILASGAFRRVQWPFEHPSSDDALYWLLPEGCAEGWFLLDDTCTPCPNGTSSRHPAALDAGVCEACPAGSFGPATGSTACLPCTAGTYEAMAGMSACSLCVPGSFQDFPGALACRPCSPGAYTPDSGASACQACQAGTFQSDFWATGCEPCQSDSYSSAGDASCPACGVQPNASQLPCAPIQAPFASALWISVQGQDPHYDSCLASPPRSTLRRVRTHRLFWGALCKHTLRVLGRPGLDRTWQETGSVELVPLASLTVIPYNDTFYPLLCRQGQGFGVLFILKDSEGRLVPTTEAAVMRILDPSGTHTLFQAPCSSNGSACHTLDFCPTMDVQVRVSLPSVALEGSAFLSMGRSSQCPPVAGWTLAEEPQALARSISAAAPVAVAVRSATWSVLEAVAGIGGADQRHGAAQAMMATLSAVAAAEELHSPLAPALTAAVTEAARILALAKPSPDVKPGDETGATVVERTTGQDEGSRAGVPQRFSVNDIRLEGVDDQFDELRAAVRAAMKQDPGRVLNVEWWLQ